MRLGPKAGPSVSVESELGIFQFRADAVSHLTTLPYTWQENRINKN